MWMHWCHQQHHHWLLTIHSNNWRFCHRMFLWLNDIKIF
jgi:hypothetical protein